MKINVNKDRIQKKAQQLWLNNNKRGTQAMCTGSGKSKVGVDISLKYNNILIVVPTENLRDDRWPMEYDKWGHTNFFNEHVNVECYAMLHKLSLELYDLVIFDEVHRLTPLNSQNLFKYYGDILGLTATTPDKFEKIQIISKYCPVVFNYPLDQGVKDEVVAPYEINIVKFDLEKVNKTVEVKSKNGVFMQTEQQRYDYLTRVMQQMMFAGKNIKFQALNRMRFLYNLNSKYKYGLRILNNKMSNDRHLIFTGSIKQTELLSDYTYHSKSSDEHYRAFVNGEINQLATVNKLNEGSDLNNLDSALILAVNSNPTILIQRIGRIVRIRDGHKGVIWILCANNTQEEKWIAKSIAQLDDVNINYINIKDI